MNCDKYAKKSTYRISKPKLNRMFKSYTLFIVLCIIVIFPNGLFNYYWTDLRTLKIFIELGIYALIFTNLIIRIPEIKIVRFSLTNGLIIFTSFELSNFFTYSLMQHSKYHENLEISILIGLILILTVTLIITIIGRMIKKRLPTSAHTAYRNLL